MTLLDPQNPIPPSVLTDGDYVTAAKTLGCEIAVIKAVTATEAPDGPFDSQGRPTILFEPKVFSNLTQHAYDADYPAISTSGVPVYGKFSEQYPKLAVAVSLDQDSALKAASWGAFQILGTNFAAAGFTEVEAMVTAMRAGVAHHLNAFVNFIQANAYLVRAVQAKDWTLFALHYNGAGYAANHYDTKLEAAYNSIVGGN